MESRSQRITAMSTTESSRFVEIMLDQDENGDLQVKPSAAAGEADAAAPATQPGWLSRVFRACFRRPAAESAQQAPDDLEMGAVSRGTSATRASVTRSARRRSTLQQGVVEEEPPGALQVQWSGPSVSELRRETEPGDAVLASARSVGGRSVAGSVSTSQNSEHA